MARIELPEGTGPEVGLALQLAPHFAEVVNAYEKACARSPLDRRLHEVVRIRVAHVNQCTLCLTWRNADWGASEDLIAAVPQWRESDLFTPAERVALEYAERFATDSANIDDDMLERLGAELTPAQIVDLTLVVGKYLAMGRFMQVLGLDQVCNISYDDSGTLVVTT